MEQQPWIRPDDLCDSLSGTCAVSNSGRLPVEDSPEENTGIKIIYVGDPMCSWCWGMSPALIKLRDNFANNGIGFRLVVGGLRPGGGDRWDENRKTRLRQTWESVAQKSGQPFGFKLLDLENFDYDTEPACRAVVAARPFAGQREMEFFEEIQRKFYVDSHDPKEVEFYRSICNKTEIDFNEFRKRFEDESIIEETFEEFDINRQWGVQAFPAVLVSKNDKLQYITQGFITYEKMEKKIREIV